MLSSTQALAEQLRDEQAKKLDIPFEVKRVHPYRLAINIGGCETLMLGFGSVEHWKEAQQKEGYSYEAGVLERSAFKDSLGDKDLMWAAGFCKTQYAEQLVEHRWVADLLRSTAAYCKYTDVYDEGDYYHTGNLDDASKAIDSNGALIAGLGQQLRDTFGAKNVVPGGITKIKHRPRGQKDGNKK